MTGANNATRISVGAGRRLGCFMDLVPVELFQIVISERTDVQVIVLRERDGTRAFPIYIGLFEAAAIDRKLKNVPIPRPLTHDLLAQVIEQMGGRLERVVINDLRDSTFYARLHIRQGQKLVDVDSRPSDAMALAVRGEVPLFVARHVLDQVSASG